MCVWVGGWVDVCGCYLFPIDPGTHHHVHKVTSLVIAIRPLGGSPVSPFSNNHLASHTSSIIPSPTSRLWPTNHLGTVTYCVGKHGKAIMCTLLFMHVRTSWQADHCTAIPLLTHPFHVSMYLQVKDSLEDYTWSRKRRKWRNGSQLDQEPGWLPFFHSLLFLHYMFSKLSFICIIVRGT